MRFVLLFEGIDKRDKIEKYRAQFIKKKYKIVLQQKKYLRKKRCNGKFL